MTDKPPETTPFICLVQFDPIYSSDDLEESARRDRYSFETGNLEYGDDIKVDECEADDDDGDGMREAAAWDGLLHVAEGLSSFL